MVVYSTHSDYAYEASDGTLYREVADFENGICHKVPVPGARPPPDVVSPPPRWPGRWHDTRVEVLEPATRSCFRLLGAKGPKVTMVLKTSQILFPGVLLRTDKEFEETRQDPYWPNGWDCVNFKTTYVPQMLERFAKEDMAGRVKVVWKADCGTQQFLDRRVEIEKIGWKILNVKDQDRQTTFTARWRGVGPLGVQRMQDLSIC